MPYEIQQKRDHILIDVLGDMRINSFVELKGEIDRLIESDVAHIDFDLSGVNSIDSSSLRLIINLNKRLQEKGGGVLLVNPSKVARDILESTNLVKVLKVFPTTKEYDAFLTRQSGESTFDYWSVGEECNAIIRKVSLKCPICENPNVFGYCLNPEYRHMEWVKNMLLPTCAGATGDKDSDFDRSRVAVCVNCHMASAYLQDFNVTKDDGVVKKSRLDEGSVALLTKSAQRRKKIMENLSVAAGDDFFKWPRTDAAVLTSYRLAKECARSASNDRESTDAFALTYLNIMDGELSPAKDEAACFDSARAWGMELLETTEKYTEEQVGQVFYYLIMLNIRMEKNKDAKETLERFDSFFEKIHDNITRQAVAFWHQRAHQIV